MANQWLANTSQEAWSCLQSTIALATTRISGVGGVEEFNPDRLVKGERADQNMLMVFGAGHRVSIARNTAMTSVWKVSATLLRNYEFTPVAGNIDGKIEIRSRGFAELVGGLNCTTKLRV